MLKIYYPASGQQINMDTNLRFTFPRLRPELERGDKDVLEVQTKTLKEKYLGMPLDAGSMTNGAFKGSSLEWVKGWMEQCLLING